MAAGFEIEIANPNTPPEIWYARICDANEAMDIVSVAANSTAVSVSRVLTEMQVANLKLEVGEVRRA